MDAITFYGSKKNQIRDIPSDSEDSEIEEESDSEEEWTPESGLRPSL